MEIKQQNTESLLPRSRIYQRYFETPDLTYSISSHKTKPNPQISTIQYLKSRKFDRHEGSSKQHYVYSLRNPSQPSQDSLRNKRAKTIDSELKLPTIKTKKYYRQKPPSFEKSNPRKVYLQPTVEYLMRQKKKQGKAKKNEFKRICSVNCLKGHNKKEKESSHNATPMRQYIAAEAQANYPQTQLNRYLAKMRSLEEQAISKKYVYTTFFGIQPQFYKLQTEYAKQIEEDSNNLPFGASQRLRVEIPIVPAKEDIADFIKQYSPFNNDIVMSRLFRSPHFIIQHSREELYFGEMVGDKKEGVGILIQDKKAYQGLFQNNMKLKGLEVNTSGIYKGQFLNEKRNGQGEFQWFNGQYYIGEWRDGNRQGNGVWTNKHGDSYNGEWIKGKGQGYGVYIVNGQEYKGNFVGFKKDGWGKQKFINGDLYDGHFSQGFPSGKGKYTWSNGTKYQGVFIAGLRSGQGVLKTADGFKYKGPFLDQKPQGLCEIQMPNGDIYHGSLRNGKKNGRGTLVLRQSGKVLDGYWQDDNFTRPLCP